MGALLFYWLIMISESELDATLAREIGFDAGDLSANGGGELTAVQGERLRAEYAKLSSQSMVAGMVMLGFLAFVVVVAAVFATARDAPGVAAALGVAGALLVVGVFRARWTKRSPPALTVETIEGVVRCREIDDGYRVDVGGVTFFVFGSVFKALIDGRPYRIHYVNFRSAGHLRPISAVRL